MSKGSVFRTFKIVWRYEDLEKGIEFEKVEEFRTRRLRDSLAEVTMAQLHVMSILKRDEHPVWQGYFKANHAFIWDVPMEFMYSHIALNEFTEHGIKATKVEI